MLKIRRPLGRLIFNMGIAIPGKTVFLIEKQRRARKNSTYREMVGEITYQSSKFNEIRA